MCLGRIRMAYRRLSNLNRSNPSGVSPSTINTNRNLRRNPRSSDREARVDEWTLVKSIGWSWCWESSGLKSGVLEMRGLKLDLNRLVRRSREGLPLRRKGRSWEEVVDHVDVLSDC